MIDVRCRWVGSREGRTNFEWWNIQLYIYEIISKAKEVDERLVGCFNKLNIMGIDEQVRSFGSGFK